MQYMSTKPKTEKRLLADAMLTSDEEVPLFCRVGERCVGGVKHRLVMTS